MSMDNRSRELLIYLLQHPSCRSSEVSEHFAISKRQFNYSFDKINEYLRDNCIEPILRTKRGIFVIPPEVYSHFHETIQPDKKEYVYSEKERQNLILLSLLTRWEEYSLLHIADIASVSKNTVLIDLKEAQRRIEAHRLRIQYSRRDGYHIVGEEIEKRYLIMELVHELIRTPNCETLFLRVCGAVRGELLEITNRIVLVEKALHIRISDERLNELRYIVLVTIQRIRRNKVLRQLPAEYYAINGTHEFNQTVFLLSQVEHVNEEEYLFMTLQFLISNIHDMSSPVLVEHEYIYRLVEQIVENFEQIGCIRFKDRKNLCNFLFQHFKPAYFRIRYHFHIDMDMADIILNEYCYLQEIVDQAIAPVEQEMGCRFPRSEVFYIMIILGGWLRKENHIVEPNRIMKAVVVCNNGISVSNYLYMTLKGMFKNIVFLDCLSERDFHRYQKPFDIVFSNHYLETEKKLYVVKPMMTRLEKSQFYLKVTCDMLGIVNQSVAVDDIMEIVSRCASEYDTLRLYDELQAYFYQGQTEINMEDMQIDPSFRDVLPPQNVFVESEAYSWKDVVDRLAQPLLLAGDIEERYVQAVKKQIEEYHPYIMIDDGFVVLHAGVDDGALAVAMSFMKLPRRISIEGYLEADEFLLLATPNTKIHLKALNQMLDVLVKGKGTERLRGAKDAAEAYQIIFSKTTEEPKW